jgi:hypothetical protein
MAGRVSEPVWEECRQWIRKQQASGLKVAQFFWDNGLHEVNFHAGWHRLAKLSGHSPRGAAKHTGGKQKLQAFVQLPLPSSAATTSGSSWGELSLADGIVVRVPASNLTALETVLRRLNGLRQESRYA